MWPDDQERALPRPLGAYTLLKQLGRGGMGEVFLARRAGFAGAEKLCVVKCLRGVHEDDPEYIARFLDEARTVVRLDHRNICRTFDVATTDDVHYFAMELVHGRDLRTLQMRAVEAGGSLPPAVSLVIIGEVLDALDYAHHVEDLITLEPLNIVHRDISPQNVMVTFDGEVKLIDFGLARSRMKLQQTQAGVVMGKVAYMAPEQARADGVDARCDLYAAGVMAYELLAGERFYGALSTQEIWRLVGRGHRPAGLDRLPVELRAILERALAPEPARRYPSCEAFREALLGYAARAGLLASSSDLSAVMAAGFATERDVDVLERRQFAKSLEGAPVGAELAAWEGTESLVAVPSDEARQPGRGAARDASTREERPPSDDSLTVPVAPARGHRLAVGGRAAFWSTLAIALVIVAVVSAIVVAQAG